MSQDSPAPVLRVSHRFDAPAERVFAAWLDAGKAGRWLFTTPTGQNVRCDIDARPGGSFVIVDRREGEDVEHVGQYLEIDRPHRLSFTFAVPKYSSAVTRVTIDVLPQGPAACELILTHQGVLPEWASSTATGWQDILAALDSVLASDAA